MSKTPQQPEPPKNPIALSVEQRTGGKSSDSANEEIGRSGWLPSSSVSNVVGNLFLLVILVSLISIPFLVYFTDTGSRAKQELRTLVRHTQAPAALSAPAREELESAHRRIADLERQVEVLEARKVVAAEASPTLPVAPPVAAPKSPEAKSEPPVTTLPRREYDLAKLFNGVGVRTVLDLTEGDTATKERVTPESYELQVILKVAVPKADTSIGDLTALNPSLPSV
ncbi:MAG: hypothetical protein ABL994_25185, partial [Verrucomicrobiales bacterium]